MGLTGIEFDVLFSIFEHVGKRRIILGDGVGENLLKDLNSCVGDADDGETIDISFDRIQLVSTRVISTLLVPFLLAPRTRGPRVSILTSKANEDLRDVIDKCLDYDSVPSAPLFVANLDENGDLDLLGRVDETVRHTWSVARRFGELRASDLAEAMNISPQLANNRLAPFLRVGALVRLASTSASGVREYIYCLPQTNTGHRSPRRRRAS